MTPPRPRVKLNIVGEYDKEKRTTLYCLSEEPLFVGISESAMDYCCGKCGRVLVTGVEAKQFASGDKPTRSVGGATIQPLILTPGDHMLRGPIRLTPLTTIITTEGPLIVQCICFTKNEMVAPNIVFDN